MKDGVLPQETAHKTNIKRAAKRQRIAGQQYEPEAKKQRVTVERQSAPITQEIQVVEDEDGSEEKSNNASTAEAEVLIVPTELVTEDSDFYCSCCQSFTHSPSVCCCGKTTIGLWVTAFPHPHFGKVEIRCSARCAKNFCTVVDGSAIPRKLPVANPQGKAEIKQVLSAQKKQEQLMKRLLARVKQLEAEADELRQKLKEI